MGKSDNSMVFKNSCLGITLVEILVVLFIIATLLTILISDFPKIQRQFALSRATYKFAQDLRKVQDMALSGENLNLLNVSGYGIFVDLRYKPVKEYKIYADLNGDERYTPDEDYILYTVDLNKDAKGVVISNFENISTQYTSINFSPPNPKISIFGLYIDLTNPNFNIPKAGIVFNLEADSKNQRTVYVWKSGLIEAK